jgi:hypothetical protein
MLAKRKIEESLLALRAAVRILGFHERTEQEKQGIDFSLMTRFWGE